MFQPTAILLSCTSFFDLNTIAFLSMFFFRVFPYQLYSAVHSDYTAEFVWQNYIFSHSVLQVFHVVLATR
jgi:hypothetical protein